MDNITAIRNSGYTDSTVGTDSKQLGGSSLPINDLIKKFATLPPPQYIFKGIIHPSVGAIFGPAKSSKTITGESLLLSIASGREQFLGEKIYSPTRKVFIVSLEEFYRNRTERNKKQIEYFTNSFHLNEEWTENVFVVDDSFPRYILSENHWVILEKAIEKINPAIVMIDSLTRLTIDPIEDSTVATRLMKRLREISHRQQVAIVLIHHSQKIENRPITLATLAGSRVIGQELDFMIGINRTGNNIRYMKDVAFRYAADDSDQVITLGINEHRAVTASGYANEMDLITNSIKTVNENDTRIFDHFVEVTSRDPAVVVPTSNLIENMVDPGFMSKPTLHASLARLIKQKAIAKIKEGQYKLLSQS